MTGPSVVALGGGHGLAASLQALRTYADAITAVVSVADDGGSSGRLRLDRPDLPAPGDVRRCLCALAEDESVLAATVAHRFAVGTGDGLDGHAFGNLLLAAYATELGSFAAAIDAVGALVGAVGTVLPATSEPVTLTAQVGDGRASLVCGQVGVQNSRDIQALALEPSDAISPTGVTNAIVTADQVVIGPGSLFTSVLAAALAPAVTAAIRDTAARCVYVANLGPQVPETEGLDLAGHVDALVRHGVRVDMVVCDEGSTLWPSRADAVVGADGVSRPVVVAPVADDRGRTHHPARLGAALAGWAR